MNANLLFMFWHQAVNGHSENLPQGSKITGDYHINLLVKTSMQTRQGTQRLLERRDISKKYFA